MPPPGGGAVVGNPGYYPYYPYYPYHPYYPYYRGYYPWGYGGYGFGAFYGGIYYPWGYGGFGFGAYYGGIYDPWFYQGGYPAYPAYYSSSLYDGSVRLKVKPRGASVYVDGYFAGQVDDFDGTFQRLHVEPGAHRIEVRADGYETLSFEVQVPGGRTVNYSGDLKQLPK